MLYLLEALWYSILILLKVWFWPIVIIIGIVVVIRIFAAIFKDK